MTNFDHFRPSMPRLVQILVFPDFQLLDAAGPITTFEEANREMPAAAYRLQIVSRIGGPVGSSSGVQVFAEPFADGPVDTLIIAGGRGTIACSHCTETLSFIHAASAWARRMASVCTGALILGAAGLLDGRRVTTHWRHAAELARNYPQSRVEPDHIFIRDEKFGHQPGLPPASIWPWQWWLMIWGKTLPNGPRNRWLSITAGPPGSRNSRCCSTSIAPPADFRL